MGGIFDKVAPTEGQAGQEQEADISMDDLPLPQIPFDGSFRKDRLSNWTSKIVI